MKLLTHECMWRGGRTVVAFGMFDGVHEGHACLLRKANELAALNDLKSVVYTFSTHPMATYAPDRVPLQLNTRSEKIREIAMLGVDAAVLRPFDQVYAACSKEEFVRSFVDALHPEHVVIGFNYTFGCKGAGKAEDMIRLGAQYGFKTHVLDEVQRYGEPISSTRIRAAIDEGSIELANELLGRPYSLCGAVQRGKQLGRQLSFPTANLAWPKGKAVPPCGVYAARAYVDGQWHIAAVNIGRHPTVPEGPETIEAHLIDYEGPEFYGHHMRLLLFKRLRGEKRFESLEALRCEVMKNRDEVKAYFLKDAKLRLL